MGSSAARSAIAADARAEAAGVRDVQKERRDERGNQTEQGQPVQPARVAARQILHHPDIPGTEEAAEIAERVDPAPSEVKFAADLYGAFPVKRLFWVVLTVFCSERERPFFVPSPAIRSPERAE